MDFFLEYDKIHKENVVELDTDMGKIEITLFNETKFHRSNFLYLSKLNYFKSTQFYRVINNFIIQGGNSDNRKIWKKRKSIGKYLLPVDNNHGFKHSRGMVSMPSSIIKNPHKLASPYEFFIVQSKTGAHFLDGDYTLFGKVTKGMDVVDKISSSTEMVDRACRVAKTRKILKNGDKIIITAGVPFGKVGTTNTLRIAKIISDNKLT